MLKLNRILGLLPCFLLMTGCSDDEGISLDTSKVKAVEDFVDARDNKTYRCVQIGDQIWMVDNLEYFLPGGAAEGCYTWEQETLKLDGDIEIEKDAFTEIYNGVVNDPNHDWKKEDGVVKFQLQQMLGYYDMFGQEKFVETMVGYYKNFGAALLAAMDAYKVGAKDKIALDAFQKAEEKNGDYSKIYGLLYSLEGARKAVPEGWRLPTDQDWQRLEAALGVPAEELNKLNEWRGEGCGTFLKEGGAALFEAKMAGGDTYTASDYQWIRKEECAYFWADEEKVIEQSAGSSQPEEGTTPDAQGGTGAQAVVKEGMIRQLALYSNKIWRGTTRLNNTIRDVAYSVRCVRDAK